MSLSSSVDSDFESAYLERERILLFHTIGLCILKDEESEEYIVKGNFNKGVDLFNLGSSLQEEGEGERTTITFGDTRNTNFLEHMYTEKKSLCIEEVSGYFEMYGFTEEHEILYAAQSLEHFLTMQ